MATSDNGWLVLDEDTKGRQPHLRSWAIPGVRRRLLLRDGSAGFLLVHLTLWFHDKIEPIDTGSMDDWGWSPRRMMGSSRWSNHASGTACDLNATKHPMGVRTSATFSQAEIRQIHRRLRLYQGCIRWGGDYDNTSDAMHFELVKGLIPVQSRARELTSSPRGKRILKVNPGAKAVIFQ